MTIADDLDVVRGSGNVFQDLDIPNADAEQLKAILATQIIGLLDAKGLSTRKAAAMTGFPAADFSRIRNAKLARFTIERLMTVLNRFDRKVDVAVSVHRRKRHAALHP